MESVSAIPLVCPLLHQLTLTQNRSPNSSTMTITSTTSKNTTNTLLKHQCTTILTLILELIQYSIASNDYCPSSTDDNLFLDSKHHRFCNTYTDLDDVLIEHGWFTPTKRIPGPAVKSEHRVSFLPCLSGFLASLNPSLHTNFHFLFFSLLLSSLHCLCKAVPMGIICYVYMLWFLRSLYTFMNIGINFCFDSPSLSFSAVSLSPICFGMHVMEFMSGFPPICGHVTLVPAYDSHENGVFMLFDDYSFFFSSSLSGLPIYLLHPEFLWQCWEQAFVTPVNPLLHFLHPSFISLLHSILALSFT